MNKILSSIIGLILLISLAVGASATVDVTYNYDQNNVKVEAYNCADALCKQVKTFSGTLNPPTINKTTSTVSYPTQLQDFGYSVFHFSKGFLPKVTRTDFSGTGKLTEDITFNKVKVCRSVIDTFTATNDAKANVPLAINVAASLDANTNSAFTFTQNTVEFVPQDKINDYYSTDVRVTLTIKDSNGATANQQTKDFTAANGNPIKADESKKIEFEWTPAQNGQYNIKVETEVIDDQCASAERQSSSKDINVLQGMPRNQCYSILNGLKTQTDVVRINENMQTEFTKISNHANNYASTDANYKLTPTQTQVQYTVTGPSGETVYSQATTLNANSDDTTPTKQTFTWKPTKIGDHTITATGTAVGTQCNGLNNVADTIALKLFVSEKPKYELKIVLVDSQTGNKVENARVKLTWDNNENALFSNAKGEAAFSQLESRTYNYEITHKDFQTLKGTVAVTNSDQTLTLSLQRATPTTQKFKVEVQVVDQLDSKPVNGAKVKLNGYVGSTSSNGKIQFTEVANGEYDFEITHQDYETGRGKITVNNADITTLVKLKRLSTAPQSTTKAKHKIFIDSIRMPNAFEVSPGDQLEIIVNLENAGTRSLKGLKATATIQELGISDSAGPVDKVSVGNSATKRLLLTIPEDAEKGSYYVRITMNDEQVSESKRVVYREIEII